MVLKRRSDGKMWKNSFNFNFIFLMSGLLHLMVLVTCEPVCYTCLSLDDSNRYMKMVDCDGTDKIFMQFAASKDVKLDDLLLSPCGYPVDYPFTHENAYKAITCSTTNLPLITDGSFDCAPNTDVSFGETCAVTCNDGFHAGYSNQVECEVGTTNQEGKWSEGNFVCHAITCQDVLLPTVNSGVFNCSGHSIGDKCNLTCDNGYYPYLSKEVFCEEYDNNMANWTVENFECFECNEWNEWQGSEYKFFSNPQSWEECRDLCRSDNSDLVTIEDKVENEFVYKMLQNCNKEKHGAIGLNDLKTEGMFEWSDGTVSTYRKWAEGEPNGGAERDCVIMNRQDGEWYNWPCMYNRHAVCERSNSRT